jgi:hypothetical protein
MGKCIEVSTSTVLYVINDDGEIQTSNQIFLNTNLKDPKCLLSKTICSSLGLILYLNDFNILILFLFIVYILNF